MGGLLGLLAGCNMITGADGVSFYDDDDANGPSNSTPNDGPDPIEFGEPHLPEDLGYRTAAEGVTLTRITLNQGVQRELMLDGEAVDDTVPVIAGRPGLLRLHYETNAAYEGDLITARLYIDEEPPLETITVLAGTSSDGDLESTINFDLTEADIALGSHFRVELLQAGPRNSTNNPGAMFPNQGDASFGAETGGALNVVIVPIEYNGDGSGRMPDTSSQQLALYEEMFYALYPTATLNLTVHAPMVWNQNVAARGETWSNLLSAVADLRQSENADFDTYYYGVFQPAASVNTFCSDGCYYGLGYVAADDSDYGKASIGLGYSGRRFVETAMHEVGHNHGRSHTPCGGPSNPDPAYPYADARIGRWGYNILTGELHSPNGDRRDWMSYCDPTWMSDYSFREVFERLTLVNAAADFQVPSSQQYLSWRRIEIRGGHADTRAPITLRRPPAGAAVPVTVETQGGQVGATARYLPYDHIDGGVLFVPPTASGLVSAQVGGASFEIYLP